MATLRRIGASRFTGDHAVVWLWLTVNALDVLTTNIGFRLGDLEANPLTAGLIARYGQGAAYSVKLLVALVSVILLFKLRKLLLLRWATLVVAAVTVSNVAILLYTLHSS